jgi:actin related protein 2/3 complex, subunit 5
MAAAFRKIDIDAFDEDVLQESELYEPDPRDPAQVLQDAKQKAAAVRAALSKCVFCILSCIQLGGMHAQGSI